MSQESQETKGEKKFQLPSVPDKFKVGIKKEKRVEKKELPEEVVEKTAEKGTEEAPVPSASTQTQPSQAPALTAEEEERVKSIEKILAQDLEEVYMQMSPEQQVAFKAGGEQAARKINGLMQKTKIKVAEILNIIKNWLKLIPGVNKFFFEQEAKIKTERILKLKK